MKPLPQLADYAIPDTTGLECKLLATLLGDSTMIPQAMRLVKSEMFSSKENKKVWDTILEMYNAREEVNLVTVMPRVDKKNYIDNILTAQTEWSINGLSGLMGAFVDTYIKRCVYIKSVEALQKINNGTEGMTIVDGLAEVKDNVMNGFRDDSAKPTSVLANELAEKIQKGVVTRVPTSIGSLNFLTYGGFAGGNLVILAARPSCGKTTIALQMALNASRIGRKTMVFSLEMSAEELTQRMIMSTGYIKPEEFFTRRFDWANYEKAVSEVGSNDLLINEKSSGVDEICQKIRVGCQTDDIKFVVIDYLGLIPITDKRVNTATALGEITRKLKLTAKDCNIPILLLCQLNRQSASENRSPQLYDLRDSGAIEQDADIVVMLERAKDDTGTIIDNTIDMWVRKNRNGKCNFDTAIRLIGNEVYSNFVEEGAAREFPSSVSDLEPAPQEESQPAIDMESELPF